MVNTYEYTVVPEHIDVRGKMKVLSLCSNMINAIGQNIRKEGYGIDVMNRENRSWVLIRSAFEIDIRPTLYSSLYINVWAVPGNGLSYNRCMSVLDGEGNEVARGTTEWCVIDLATRRPLFPELNLDEAPADIPCESPRRIRNFTHELSLARKVYHSDCDFNGHLNNTRYMDMFYDMLPDEMIETCSPVRLDINYRQEARCGESISIGISKKSSNEWLFIANADDRTLCTASLVKKQ